MANTYTTFNVSLSQYIYYIILVSKETAAAERVKQKFGFIELVDKGQSDSEKGLWQLG